MEEIEKATPMMRQFLELKQEYSDCVLLFRAGDFYETFYDDAKLCAKILEITLTARAGVPMAGVPHHSIMPYIKKLLEHNHKIALCEQLEDPKFAKGVVKRGVTRVITPGTILEDEYISSKFNNYIMSIYTPKNISENFGISLVDITTGEFITTQIKTPEETKTLIRKYSPNEIIINEDTTQKELKSFIENSKVYLATLSPIRYNLAYAQEILKRQFGLNTDELGISQKEYSIISAGALLFYIYKLQKANLSHINKIQYQNLGQTLLIDYISLRNLEICENIFTGEKSKTLLGLLNKTKTNAGSRLLKKHIVAGLIEEKEITERLDCIEELNKNANTRNEISNLLDSFFDIERISARIVTEMATPRDLISLKQTLKILPTLKEILSPFSSKLFKDIKNFQTFGDVMELLEKSIVEDAPAHTREIGYIKKEYDLKLKELYDIAYNSKQYLAELEEKEKLRTGITTLKIRYNRVFGYYLEIPRSQMSKMPIEYIPTQTLANSQRYTTEELKEKESLIVGAEDKILSLEKEIYLTILNYIKNHIKALQELSRKIALLDVFVSNSIVSEIYGYIRPSFSSNSSEIVLGRNPIVERFVSNYTPNDCKFDSAEKVKIITGPNMSGKSTYLRQIALISIMAQAGMFVPAESAKLKIYDKIFTRIGAHDETSSGQSTFMVEMTETANILNNATSKSLVLLDEIGRGTSTYDGLAIAWAVVEFLNKTETDTIFATHYHQLNKLEEFYTGIVNYQVLVREEGENIEFIHKIAKGGTDRSYGIYVGKIAGIPKEVLDRAKDIQLNIENEEEIKITQDFKEKLQKNSKKLKEQTGGNSLNNYF